MIGSNKTTDRCGVCGGNSLNCKMVEGEMRPRQRGTQSQKKTFLLSDYRLPQGFVTVLDIPAGASEVEVKQVSSGYRDGCYLGEQQNEFFLLRRACFLSSFTNGGGRIRF